MKVRRGFEVQGSCGRGRPGLRPDKGGRKKLQQIIDLSIVVIVFGDLLVLGVGIMQKFLNQIALPGRWDPPVASL